MQVIARRTGGEVYLVVQDDTDLDDPMSLGQVFDANFNVIFPPRPIGEIAGRGYWEDYNIGPEETAILLARATPPPPTR